MITVRRSEDRGHSQSRGLQSRHAFSFSSYQDPRHMGVSVLRVLNEDHVAPGSGFPPRSHDNMEMLTCVLRGVLSHRDSMGNEIRVAAGELQLMSAGTGVTHSEYNHEDEPLELLQVWIYPNTHNTEPSYQHRRRGASRGLQLAVSPDGAADSLRIRQKARVWLGHLGEGEHAPHTMAGKTAWIQLLHGSLQVAGATLHRGDGAELREEPRLDLAAAGDTEFLLFDLP